MKHTSTSTDRAQRSGQRLGLRALQRWEDDGGSPSNNETRVLECIEPDIGAGSSSDSSTAEGPMQTPES